MQNIRLHAEGNNSTNCSATETVHQRRSRLTFWKVKTEVNEEFSKVPKEASRPKAVTHVGLQVAHRWLHNTGKLLRIDRMTRIMRCH